MSRGSLVVHGHFYQPPRENPWTEAVPRQPSAAPFHDWNERITAECYRPNGWARILDDQGLIVGRKAFQRPMKDGAELLRTIQDVYLDKDITVA